MDIVKLIADATHQCWTKGLETTDELQLKRGLVTKSLALTETVISKAGMWNVYTLLRPRRSNMENVACLGVANRASFGIAPQLTLAAESASRYEPVMALIIRESNSLRASTATRTANTHISDLPTKLQVLNQRSMFQLI